MKLTNKQIADFALANLGDTKLPIKLAYAISLNLKECQSAFEVFSEKQRELLDQYAERDENGEIIIDDIGVVLKDDGEAYSKQSNELAELEAELNISTVPFDVFDKLDDDKYDSLSAKQLNALDFMLEK